MLYWIDSISEFLLYFLCFFRSYTTIIIGLSLTKEKLGNKYGTIEISLFLDSSKSSLDIIWSKSIVFIFLSVLSVILSRFFFFLLIFLVYICLNKSKESFELFVSDTLLKLSNLFLFLFVALIGL